VVTVFWRTLARQICSETNALYINLAETGVVGSNFITGGLAKTGSTEPWKSGRMGIVIDALDEGRLRVNQAGFTDFLLDVKEIANDRIDARATYPVLFGRTGVIQDTWILLHDWFDESEIGVVEIECYDRETASEFCFRVTKKIRQDRRSKGEARYVEPANGERKIIELILENLRQKIDAERDADQQRKFAGYAPVLTAVAYRVSEETNPWKFLGRPDIQESVSNISLAEISNNILEREHGKLKHKPNFSGSVNRDKLYAPNEQLDYLSAKLYQTERPGLPTAMSDSDRSVYVNALEGWIPDHPFFDGTTHGASSAVFEAQICVRALLKRSEVAVKNQLLGKHRANPFVLEFYRDVFEHTSVPSEHVGVIYGSVRSGLALNEQAILSISESGSAEDELDIEIVVIRGDEGGEERLFSGSVASGGEINLGPHVKDVDIDAPASVVRLGGKEEVSVVGPVSIVCQNLIIDAESVTVSDQRNIASAVYLEAHEIDSRVSKPPLVHRPASLEVNWPYGNAYPWSTHSVRGAFETMSGDGDDGGFGRDVDEIYRRLRKFVVAFRRHGRKQLGRYKGKIEHARMTKGWGRAVLDVLLEMGVVVADQRMYFLDPDKLASETSITYNDCRRAEDPGGAFEKFVGRVMAAVGETRQ